jgi:DUF4097 and DUF4098 domain-containing protein YvlB
MKIKFFVVAIILNGVSAYCGGLTEKDLVNKQEIGLEHIDSIEILYRWEKINLFRSNTDSLIIKEYMSRNNNNYYASITNSENKLIIRRGKRPIGFLINTFDIRVEIYIPVSNTNMTIKTTSGRIIASDEYICAQMNLESSSGSISVNSIMAETVNLKTSSGSIRGERINGNTNIKTSSGNIVFGSITGDVFVEVSSGGVELNRISGALIAKASSGRIRSGMVNGNANIHTNSGNIVVDSIDGDISTETSSGRIELKLVNGSITAETSSGNIHCSIAENARNISLTTSSGSVNLNLPRDHTFNFSSITSSGILSTPFSEKLYSPVSDRKLAQGIVGEDNPDNDIDIKTNSGSIKVNWIN